MLARYARDCRAVGDKMPPMYDGGAWRRPCTMYDCQVCARCAGKPPVWRYAGFIAMPNRQWFAVLLAYLFIHGKRTRNGLNEPREDFIGTRVVCALNEAVRRVVNERRLRRPRSFVTTSDHSFTNMRPHLLCSSRSSAAHYLQIVNRKS